MFLFTYTKLFLWSMIFKKTKSDIIFDIICNNIKKSGPVLIKFIQWVLPKVKTIYDINDSEKYIQKLEELYENCDFHSFEYTNKKYLEIFGKNLKDEYVKIEEHGSGSIGQVYRLTDNNDKKYAMKILHPNINNQIVFFNLIFEIINFVPIFRRNVNYYFPIKLRSFIKDFKLQTDFINEANNNLKFTDMYKDNEYIIIPKVKKVSKHILIMDYIEGETFEFGKYSNFISSKICAMMKLFTKNNEIIYNYIHGDLHKGNWKVQLNNNEMIKLVIYDFGFCWELPNNIKENLYFVNRVFLDLMLTNNKNISDSLIKDLIDACCIFLSINSKVQKNRDIVRDELLFLLNNEKSIRETSFFIKLTINCCRNFNISLDSYILCCIIGHIHLYDLVVYITDEHMSSNIKENEKNVFFDHYYDLINICETYDIFKKYSEHLKQEMDIEKEKRNIQYNKKNEISDNKDINEKLKKLCI